MPSALAALPGGDFALLDPAKDRVVRLDEAGRLVEDWGGASQVASDMVWDPLGKRLLWIDDESTGTIAELDDEGVKATYVTMNRSVARLAATPDGAYEFGSPSYVGKFGYTPIPDPLGTYAPIKDGALQLADGSELTLESNRDGDQWRMSRSEQWTLDLQFRGVNGPRTPVLSLRDDLALYGDTLVISPTVGAYVSNPGLSRPLLALAIDLDKGTLLRAHQIAQCGFSEDANLVSRTTIDYETGQLFQLCADDEGIEVRAGWTMPPSAS